jgi:hypothetical protein
MKKMTLALALCASFSAFAQFRAESNICAIAYNSLDRHYASTLLITEDDHMKDLGDVYLTHGGSWDNRITRVDVKEGCTFIGYQYQNYNRNYNHHNAPMDGFTEVLENNGSHSEMKSFVLNYSSNKISSLKCFCL